jgi:hypothetical protein
LEDSPVKFVELLLPDCVNPPGDEVIVQFPAGKPLRSTLPVGVKQDGCVTVPTIGAEGTDGTELMDTVEVAVEVHPSLFVTVNV